MSKFTVMINNLFFEVNNDVFRQRGKANILTQGTKIRFTRYPKNRLLKWLLLKRPFRGSYVIIKNGRRIIDIRGPIQKIIPGHLG